MDEPESVDARIRRLEEAVTIVSGCGNPTLLKALKEALERLRGGSYGNGG